MIAKKFVTISFIIFLILSVILIYFTPDATAHFDLDSYGYDRIAYHFAKNNILEDPYVPGNAPIQTIGYPFFMGIIYKIFGHSVFPIIYIQVILALLSIFLLFIFTRRVFTQSVATLVVFFSVFSLSFFVYPQFLLSETLLVFFLIAFLERLSLFFQNKKLLVLVQAGLLLGISVIIKPTALAFFPILAVILLMWAYFHNQEIIAVLFFYSISFWLPVLLYLARNYILYKSFKLAPMTELNIYHVFLSKVISRINNIPIQNVIHEHLVFTGVHSFDSSGWYDAKQLFFSYVKTNPLSFIAVALQNCLKTLIGLYSTQLKLLIEPAVVKGGLSFFTQQGSFLERIAAYVFGGTRSYTVMIIALSEFIFNTIRWLFIAYGIVVLWIEKKYVWFFMFASMITQFTIITFFDGCGRYRVTFEPILIVLAAVGLCQMYSKVCKKIKRIV